MSPAQITEIIQSSDEEIKIENEQQHTETIIVKDTIEDDQP